MAWNNTQTLPSKHYTCGHCDWKVASNLGFFSGRAGERHIRICPHCDSPTFFSDRGGMQVPGVSPGSSVDGTPRIVQTVYDEARRSLAAGCHTGSVLLCRKLLAHIAVDQGAAANLSFLAYVNFLADKNFVPPNGRGWVDHIRKKGNEATHEITIMTREHAEELVTFLEMLLKFIYEFPSRIPPSS
ncbi:MAG: DUF4145 domain-containing protein [Gammaproteobacteria bacterium]|nr:DUF4145 domain-containing protein [Gammaproteobacteria bacterium]NIR85174.1 DUF4145 domain-containing protein [Gammaproteobacteria bacterium]NIU06223.1 DUF4145 domain-containing protein [Gammaproteobacteria bacterium]NIX87496.1 DUF4145 domain-containing protein [Gammaproteobacteria bacterium]